MLTKSCLHCNKIFHKPYHTSIKNWKERSKFCSQDCKKKSQIGKDAWNKGISLPPGSKGGKLCECRVCGALTKYRYSKKLDGKISCGSSECAKISRELKNKALRETGKKKRENGEYDHFEGGWKHVNQQPEEELALVPFMQDMGFIHQHLVVTGTQSKHYRLDFAHTELLIDVEIDGTVHDRPERVEKDAIRDAYFIENGWKVLRIKRSDVSDNIDAVMKNIFEFVEKERGRLSPPS